MSNHIDPKIQEIIDRHEYDKALYAPKVLLSPPYKDRAYLLSEYKRLQNEVEFWKQAADDQRDNNYLLLKDRAVMKDAFDTIGDILTDDTSTKAIEINQTINLALSHLKGE